MSTELRGSRCSGGGGWKWGSGLLLLLALGVLAGCRKTTAWAPDGKQLTVEAYGGLQIYDVASGQFRTLVLGDPKKHEALAPAWAPDSRRLAYFNARVLSGLPSASLVTLDLPSGKPTTLVAKLPAGDATDADDPLAAVRNACAAAWSPDGREIAYVAPEGNSTILWVVPASGGVPRRLTPAGEQSASPTWSPDSRQIACASAAATEGAEWDLELMDRDGAHRRVLCRAPSGLELDGGLQWSPDGARGGVVFNRSGRADNAPPLCEAWSVSLPDGMLRKLADVPGEGSFASFTPDLKSVLFLEDVTDPAGHKTPTVAVLEPPYTRARRLSHPARYEQPGCSIPMLSPNGKAVSLEIQDGEKPLMLGLRYLDGSAAVDATIPR